MAARAGIAVVDNKGRRSTLGPVLQQGGRLYSVVASHAVEKNSSLRIPGTDIVVGNVNEGVLKSNNISERDIGFSIRTFPLAQATRVEPADARWATIADALPYLGQKVFKVSSTGVTEGEISAIDSPFHMKDGKSQKVLKYRGALEITSGNNFAADGDAGAIIYASDGAVLGILIGTADDRYYVAPASALEEKYGLRLATKRDLLQHNARIEDGRKQPSHSVLVAPRPALREYNLLVHHLTLGGRRHAAQAFGTAMASLNWDQVLRANPETDLEISAPRILFRPTLVHGIINPVTHRLPDLRLEDLQGKLREVVTVLTRSEDGGIFASKSNYVVGATSLFTSVQATYQRVMTGLKSALNNISPNTVDLLADHQIHVSTSAYQRLQQGRPVSLISAWLLLSGLRESLGEEMLGTWQNVSVDPAMFYSEVGAAELLSGLNERKLVREFEHTFRSMAPSFKHVSIVRLLTEVSQGQSVRHSTASVITETARVVMNSGIEWKEALRSDAHPAPAEVIVSTTEQGKPSSTRKPLHRIFQT